MQNATNNTSGDLLTTSEAARLLTCSEGRIRQLARSGRLQPALHLNTGMRLFDRRSIEELRGRTATTR